MDKTKERIIEAATRLFAERGLDGVTVREICRAAKVNGALVNYHFRSKEGLYRECVERVYATAHGSEMADAVSGVRDARSWKAAVRTWVETFERAFHAKEGVGSSAAGIFRQEAMRPSKMKDYLEEHFARPARNRLFRLMRMATDSDHEAYLWSASLWVQLGGYALYHPEWRRHHRPPDVAEREWRQEFVTFVCDRIFGALKFRRVALCAAALLFAGGCATTEADRAAAAREMQTRLVQDTADWLTAHPGPLTLANALALARERTLKLTQRELEVQLAKVDRATAFSAFLPNVELAYGRTLMSGRMAHLPLGLGALRTSGADFESAGLVISQPVFTPVAWTLFAESLYGVRIKDFVRARARQLLDVQVAVCFYKAAVASRMAAAYELRLKSGEALANRVTRLAAEGYALAAERARAEARVAADAYGLLQARHARTKARQELADILRFWPLAEFEVDGESIFSAVAASGGAASGAPLEDLVWTALVNRKDLRAADETLALRKAQVVEALAGFLPNVIAGGGGASLTLEDVALHGWAGSLAGVWSVFGGFRTVQQYRAARATREAEFRLNEDRMLAVVLSVADCWRSLREAQVRATVAAKASEAATLDHAEAVRRFDDGRETLSTVLDKVAVRDEAEVNLVSARYAAALSAIMLRQAVGFDIFKTGDTK